MTEFSKPQVLFKVSIPVLFFFAFAVLFKPSCNVFSVNF